MLTGAMEAVRESPPLCVRDGPPRITTASWSWV